MKVGLTIDKAQEFLASFKEIDSFDLDWCWERIWKCFIPLIDAKRFNISSIQWSLTEPLLWYCLSRRSKEKMESSKAVVTAVKNATHKLRDYLNNTWELGEFILYCFLESDLNAPKILTKVELKTSPNDYVKGSDGAHYKKIGEDYVLIFWESKTIKYLSRAINKALESIYDFKNWIRRDTKWNIIETNPWKYWIDFEKGVISDHILKETFNEEEKTFLTSLIYPTKESSIVNTWFWVFIWFEFNLDEFQSLSHKEFAIKVEEKLKEKISLKYQYIRNKIQELWLNGHNFYFYFLPFHNLDEDRKILTKWMTEC